MAHGTNLISKIKLPGNDTVYELHDAQAIHDVSELGLSQALVFKGTKATISNLPTTGNKVGDVWYVTADDCEYVWTDSNAWEAFGNVHDAASSDHTHNVTITGTNGTSAVTGSATVTGTNEASAVTGSVSITVPKVSKEANYAKVSTGNDTFVKSYPGATSKLAQTTVKAAGAAVNVIDTVTPTTGSVTGVSGSVTASKATAGNAITVTSGFSAGSVKAGSVTAGTAPSWTATVSDGTLTFGWSAGSHTAVTLPTITLPTASTTNITPYTFTDVTVPKAATAATTVVTGITTDTASVATVGSDVTVATGALASNGTGASVMTGLGTATTAKALTSASLAEGTSTDGILVGDTVAVTSETKTGTISGTAAAQAWTQKSGVTGAPINE